MQSISSLTPVLLTARYLTLRPFQPEDINALHALHCSPDTVLWSEERQLPLLEDFEKTFKRKLRKEFNHFYMIERQSSGSPIGFVHSYRANQLDRNCFVALVVDQKQDIAGAGVYSGLLFLNLLFSQYGYLKVFAEIYDFNTKSLGLARKTGFIEEGCLKEYRWFNGKFWDQHIFSFNTELFDAQRSRIQRILKVS